MTGRPRAIGASDAARLVAAEDDRWRTARSPLRVLRSVEPTTLVITGWALLALGVAVWYARVGDYLPALLLAGVGLTHSPNLVRAVRDHWGAR